ncbi:FAD:protein FMN transferase [Roseicella frigidaeris]|uniref:FAD:protein FMN transferase n=1 Tax=Roseicella frigidaeris TaxID=2230885 RepID=A0A327LYJ7_9PROT|nr:FAD:protein FMN transferase [Roseicella frigidaeris]RAI55187.1 FAD:protein FMN transferase [Roseicella frigidaeris]
MTQGRAIVLSGPLRRRALGILAVGGGLGGSAALQERGRPPTPVQEWRGAALGAEAHILLLHPDPAKARLALGAVVAEIERLESEFSLFRADSALSRLNRDGCLPRPSLDMRQLVAEALRLGDLTEGVFDVTVQPLWRLHARYADGPPPAKLAAGLALVGYRHIDLGAAILRFARPGMAITLNGIAQGYITDRVTDMLRDAGLPDVLVDVGELRGTGRGLDGHPWRVGLEHPAVRDRNLEVSLADAAVATSCGRGTPFSADACRHHILDPCTGLCPPADRAASVTAPNATLADGLATALVLLPHQATSLVRRAGAVDAILSEPGLPLQRVG